MSSSTVKMYYFSTKLTLKANKLSWSVKSDQLLMIVCFFFDKDASLFSVLKKRNTCINKFYKVLRKV
jgi:hypothetical protein